MIRTARFFALASALTALALLTGCTTPTLIDPARVGPFFQPSNYRATASLRAVRRVIVLPMAGATVGDPETTAALDPIFVEALRRQNRFEVATISRAECRRRFGAESIASDATISAVALAGLEADHGADAVLFIDLTAYSAYRPLTVGIRTRLAGRAPLAGEALWAFDEVFSAGNPKVANSARHYYLSSGDDAPTDPSIAALRSPGKFSAYVAAAVFATLTPPFAGADGMAAGAANSALKFPRSSSIAADNPRTP